ncbi:hypothetical protein GCM10010981_25940 [Dyella nitratireducens]|uniref:Uncharacterized protein n=1 Tax=Dyella nitratireducens TaxID=1849580 RepID=A0ABQ1G2M7_9GAMM|nr:hypothetical protein GCM10010981_25940 [Dyella nitratireducens]GLQ41029.1 hypothetical protein GCM10007902_08790 [Dyella nitratireducens]
MIAITTINSTMVNPSVGLRCARIVLIDRPCIALASARLYLPDEVRSPVYPGGPAGYVPGVVTKG